MPTRILFLQDSAINESLALCELSGVLKRGGHETRLLLGDEERDLDREIRAWDPQLCILPCSVAGHLWPIRAAARIKRLLPNCVTAMGGTHVTFSPELALDPNIDITCVGEAEGAMLDLADRLDAGIGWKDVANLCFAREGVLVRNPMRGLWADLDTLPIPDRDLYFRYGFISRFPWKKFATGRGCIHSCSFCWNTTLRGMYDAGGEFTRRKSPARVVEEIRRVKSAHPTKHIHFSDDLFTVRPSWLEAFAPLYRAEIGLPFTCNSSVELVTTRTATALREAGCHGVAIGIETGNEALRERILRKTVSNDDVRRAAGLIKSNGMKLTTFNMIASPGETLDDAFSTLRLNREIRADHVRVNIAVPIPHTDFDLDARERGLLEGKTVDRVTELKRPSVAFHADEAREFRNLFYLFRLGVHLPGVEPLLRALVRLPMPLDPLRALIPWEEKRIFNLGWLDGLRYFRHVGDPHKRTTNYVSLI